MFETLSQSELVLDSVPTPSPTWQKRDKGMLNAVAFSPSGVWIAAGSGDTLVLLWDAASGTERTLLRGHAAEVSAVTFVPNGRLLASGGQDRLIKIWDVAAGRERLSLEGHLAEITGLAFAPDGQTLAVRAQLGCLRQALGRNDWPGAANSARPYRWCVLGSVFP